MQEVWAYRTEVYPESADAKTNDLVGYDVEAVDGSIGKIDEATHEAERNYLVVDTGPWIFGKKVLLPAGVVQSVDTENSKVFVNRSRDEVKDSPEFDADSYREPVYQDEVGSYYGPDGPAHRDW